MTGTLNCGFARVAAKSCTHGGDKRTVAEKYDSFITGFGEEYRDAFEIELTLFNKRLKSILDVFRKWRGQNKDTYIQHFSMVKWKSLPESEKKLHRLGDCPACSTYHFQQQFLFPVKCARLRKSMNDSIHNSQALKNIINLPEIQNESNENVVNVPRKEIYDAARAIYSHINPLFEKSYGQSLGDALPKVKEANLQTRKSKIEVKEKRKSCQRKYKRGMENFWKKVDCDLFLATRTSFRFVFFILLKIPMTKNNQIYTRVPGGDTPIL